MKGVCVCSRGESAELARNKEQNDDYSSEGIQVKDWKILRKKVHRVVSNMHVINKI